MKRESAGLLSFQVGREVEIVVRVLAIAGLSLAACMPVARETPPPLVQFAPNLPLLLVGTDPSWSALLKDGSFSFNGENRGAIVAPLTDSERGGGSVVFRTPAPTRDFPVAARATIKPGPCSSGASDRAYPYAATLDIDYAGASPPVSLQGCAGPESLFDPARP